MATEKSTNARIEVPGVSEEVTLDRLAGEWLIHQLKGGHRFSADDLLTAWMAARHAPEATRILDLGAGIGSVGLMCLWRLQQNGLIERHLTMVEAQEVSHHLCRQTIQVNGLDGQTTLRLGDLRDPASVPERDFFDLVTGSPPYIPLGKGVVSPHPQRAACRMELRGTIADYAQTAAAAMHPDGWFVCCFAGQDPRAEAGIAAAGLHLRHRTDVYFRAILPPTVCLLAATRSPGPCIRDQFTIRDQAGVWTDAYLDLRQEMGTVLHRTG